MPECFCEAHLGSTQRLFRGAADTADGRRCRALRGAQGRNRVPGRDQPLKHRNQEGTLATAAVRDISDRAEGERERALLEQLNQARRLESVGQLAGGIAHDFNNILGVIMNYAEFVARGAGAGSQSLADVEEIRRAAERAAALTRQLLIFSRREVVKPESCTCVSRRRAGEFLRKGARRAIELVTRVGEDRWVEADPGQIEQVLVNLAVNARDAMPGGGRRLIEVDRTELDEE